MREKIIIGFLSWFLARGLIWMMKVVDRKDVMLIVERRMDKIWGEKKSERLQDGLIKLFEGWIEELKRDRSKN